MSEVDLSARLMKSLISRARNYVARIASSKSVTQKNNDVLLSFFPKAVPIEDESDLVRAADVLERQVGSHGARPLLIPRVKCRHGYFQVTSS